MGKFGNTKQFCTCHNIGMTKVIDVEELQKNKIYEQKMKLELKLDEYIKEYNLGLEHFKKAKDIAREIEEMQRGS